MIPDHVVDGAGGFGPNDVDYAMYAALVQKRHCNSRQSIRSLPPIGTAAKRRITSTVSIHACFSQDPLKALRISRKSVFWYFRFAEQRQNSIALFFRTKSEVGSPHSRQCPIHWGSNPVVHEIDRKRRADATRFANLHVVPRRHHQIGWPRHLLAKPVENWSGRLRDTIVTDTLARHAREGADPVMDVRQPPRDEAHVL